MGTMDTMEGVVEWFGPGEAGERQCMRGQTPWGWVCLGILRREREFARFPSVLLLMSRFFPSSSNDATLKREEKMGALCVGVVGKATMAAAGT